MDLSITPDTKSPPGAENDSEIKLFRYSMSQQGYRTSNTAASVTWSYGGDGVENTCWVPAEGLSADAMQKKFYHYDDVKIVPYILKGRPGFALVGRGWKKVRVSNYLWLILRCISPCSNALDRKIFGGPRKSVTSKHVRYVDQYHKCWSGNWRK